MLGGVSLPLAYFITWRTYGTLLHGDARGSVDRDHNVHGTPMLPPDPEREARAADRMMHAAVVLCAEARDVVARAVRDHAAFRGWRILALNVRSNHAHVVIDCSPALAARREMPSPERVMREFKSWGTRRLRESGLAPADVRIWADHGSTRWVNHPAGLAEAVDYVTNQQ